GSALAFRNGRLVGNYRRVLGGASSRTPAKVGTRPRSGTAPPGCDYRGWRGLRDRSGYAAGPGVSLWAGGVRRDSLAHCGEAGSWAGERTTPGAGTGARRVWRSGG